MQKRIDIIELNRIKKAYGSKKFAEIRGLPLLSITGDKAKGFLEHIKAHPTAVPAELPKDTDLIISDMLYRVVHAEPGKPEILMYARIQYVSEVLIRLSVGIPPSYLESGQKLLWVESDVSIEKEDTQTSITLDIVSDPCIKTMVKLQEKKGQTKEGSLHALSKLMTLTLTALLHLEQYAVTAGLYPVKISRRVQAGAEKEMDHLFGPTLELMQHLPMQAVNRDNKAEKRTMTIHKIRPHSRLLSHERYKNHPRFNKHIRVRGSWSGSRKIEVGEYQYEVLI
jgi:hypothetical protein